MRGERKESRNEEGRNTRVPLGVSRTKLAVQAREGYVRRWVNDSEGRLQQAEQGGYQFVEDPKLQIGDQDIDNVNRDLGARVSRVVDKTTGQKAYLMEIKEEFFQEDQEAKRKAIDETDAAIRKGKLQDGENRYIPDRGEGIKIEQR
jgi:hypothetical protein